MRANEKASLVLNVTWYECKINNSGESQENYLADTIVEISGWHPSMRNPVSTINTQLSCIGNTIS